jgi:ATP-dependent protease ClpP protease subunit
MTGSASDLSRWAEHHLAHIDRFYQRIAGAVRRPTNEVASDFAAGRYLDPHEAVRYGLIDEVASPRGTVYRWPSQPFGFRSAADPQTRPS